MQVPSLELPQAPIYGHELQNSDDPGMLHNTLSREIVPHKQEFLSSDKPLNFNFQCIDLDYLSIFYINYGVDVMITTDSLRDDYLIDIPLAGNKHIRTGDSEVTMGPGYIGAMPVTRPVSIVQQADCAVMLLKIKRKMLEQTLTNVLNLPVADPIEFQLKTNAQEDSSSAFLRVVRHICDELSFETTPLKQHASVLPAQSYILSTLLACIPNNYSDLLAQVSEEQTNEPYYIKLAEDYIIQNLQKPLHMDELVRVTGMSARSIFLAFKKFRGTSPMSFARTERLCRVYRELLNSEPRSVSVASVATKWGFNNLGYFAALYAKQYGEKPSQTLRRGRKLL